VSGSRSRRVVLGRLLYLVAAIPLAAIEAAVLIAGWVVVVCLSITPAVVPALVGFRAAVGLLARVEASLATALLGASVRPGRWQSGGRGFWGRGRAVLQDRSFWRAQAFLGLRCTVGFVVGVVQLSLVGAAAFLVGLPIYYRWLHTGGSRWQVDTLQKALLGVPVGLIGLLLLLRLVGPVASVWRRLADVLLRDESVPMPPAKRRQLLVVHVAIVGALDALFVLIWALSTWGGYFWPEWPIVVGAVPIAIHAWVERIHDRPELRRRRALAIHAGVYAALSVFFVLVWALTSRGSFWPEWAWLGLGIPLAANAAIVFTRGELSDRIEVLETTRAGAVDVQETDLRRIERDLHDGAQARLVALGMNLGMAEQKFAADPAGARELVAEARVGVEEALRELRNLARGIHPPVLTDRGLGAAIEALADHSPLPVEVTITHVARPAPAVETAAYFVAAEALTNATKHAQATRVTIHVERVADRLRLEVADDGTGGADPAGGGLSGLRRRVEALDGTLTVTSPPGGPTVVRADLPCAS
jgi:signal transduction histidine kinase